MSNETSGQVWRLKLPHEQMLVLLAIADHADAWGRHVRAELDEIIYKTGYSRRQVIRILQALENDGLLNVKATGRGRGQVKEWDIHLDKGIQKPPYVAKHAKMAPKIT